MQASPISDTISNDIGGPKRAALGSSSPPTVSITTGTTFQSYIWSIGPLETLRAGGAPDCAISRLLLGPLANALHLSYSFSYSFVVVSFVLSQGLLMWPSWLETCRPQPPKYFDYKYVLLFLAPYILKQEYIKVS